MELLGQTHFIFKLLKARVNEAKRYQKPNQFAIGIFFFILLSTKTLETIVLPFPLIAIYSYHRTRKLIIISEPKTFDQFSLSRLFLYDNRLSPGGNRWPVPVHCLIKLYVLTHRDRFFSLFSLKVSMKREMSSDYFSQSNLDECGASK